MKVAGKQSLIVIIPILMLLATFGLVTIVYQEAGIKYEAKLTSINTDNIWIWGDIELKITNDRDGQVGFTDVNVTLVNPENGESFYTYLDDGGLIDAGETITYTIFFDILISEMPSTNVEVVISGELLWNEKITHEEKTFLIPIQWEI